MVVARSSNKSNLMHKNCRDRLRRRKCRKNKKGLDVRKRTVFTSRDSNKKFRNACDKNSKKNKKRKTKLLLYKRLSNKFRNRKFKKKKDKNKKCLMLEIKEIWLFNNYPIKIKSNLHHQLKFQKNRDIIKFLHLKIISIRIHPSSNHQETNK